jgi:thiamine biosynthesis lipoprotein
VSTTPQLETQTGRQVTHTMGMPISLAMRGLHAHDAAGQEAWHEAVDCLNQVDRDFSTFRPTSYVSRLARGEIELADCPAEVAEVMALGALAEKRSQGAFRVLRRRPDGSRVLDPNGVVKGWAVERAARSLRLLDDTSFCLSAGGDMVCHTADPADQPWRVGIEDPHDTGRVIATVAVRTGAVATSGTAHRGAHVVDARTGLPPEDIASVTVIAESLTWADIDATAAFAHGADAARWLSEEARQVGLIVWADGSVARTPQHVSRGDGPA